MVSQQTVLMYNRQVQLLGYYLTIMNDGNNDSVAANGTHRGHHAPLHIGESLAFADAISLLRDGDRSHDDQIHLNVRFERDRNSVVLDPFGVTAQLQVGSSEPERGKNVIEKSVT